MKVRLSRLPQPRQHAAGRPAPGDNPDAASGAFVSALNWATDMAMIGVSAIGMNRLSEARTNVLLSALTSRWLDPSGFDCVESFAFGFAEPPVVAHRAKPDGLLGISLNLLRLGFAQAARRRMPVNPTRS
jgi:hypothetical protein